MASVTFKNISKKYRNGIVAVSDFNLEIKDKEVIVFVGPSGCGKTTTMHMIAGFENITEGELYIDSKLVNDVEPKDRDIGMVFQFYALYPHMTVFENVAFGLKPHKLSDEEIKEKIEEVSRAVEITHLFDRKPRELSGGQKQRVALARALVRDHKVVLLDEPLSNLDAKLRACMRTELIKLHEKFNMTFIYVTHDQAEAMTIADRIVVMKEGIIQQVGTPEELYSHPCNMFVAGFLGVPQMNWWIAKVTEDDGDIYVNFGELKIKLQEARIANTRVREYINKSVYVGFRAEDIHEDEASIKKYSDCVIDADVKVREFVGDRVFLHILNKALADYEFPVTVSSSCTARSGDKIKLAMNPNKIYLFDRETEEAIVN